MPLWNFMISQTVSLDVKKGRQRERGGGKKKKNAGENYQGFSSPSWQKHNVVPKDMKIFNRE